MIYSVFCGEKQVGTVVGLQGGLFYLSFHKSLSRLRGKVGNLDEIKAYLQEIFGKGRGRLAATDRQEQRNDARARDLVKISQTIQEIFKFAEVKP